ncbi:MAG: DUF255 domain-containing protein [Chlorobi bacterium]|nr:DUF255 domain-containing protein [Chlorobiota bacterium]
MMRRKLLQTAVTIFVVLGGIALTSQMIKWVDFETAVHLNKKKPKKIFIDVYTDWCGWCKVLDRKTFRDPRVIKVMNKYYHAVKLDAETRDTIYFQNKPHTYIKEYRANLIALRLLDGRMVYPSMVILDEKFNRLRIIRGYKSADDLLPILIYYGGNYYKEMKFGQFKLKTYKKAYRDLFGEDPR